MATERFICIVAGDNPEEIMKKYSSRTKVDEYCAYKFADAQKYQEQKMKIYTGLLERGNELSDEFREMVYNELATLRSQEPTDFYLDLTRDMRLDSKTGDAYTDKNPDGKFDACFKGQESMMLKNKDGKCDYSFRKKDIDFDLIHLANQDQYGLVWDLVMKKKKPKDDDEKKIYEYIKNWGNYLSRFPSRENYIITSTYFWGQVFTDGKNWYECPSVDRNEEWVSMFYDRFIKPLPDDTLISVYECARV